jgi:hypothetical protein
MTMESIEGIIRRVVREEMNERSRERKFRYHRQLHLLDQRRPECLL